MRGSDEAADYGDAAGFSGDAVDSFAIVLDKRGALNQIARRVSTDGKFGEQNQSRASGLGATGEINNFGRVAGEISDGRIDLAESNLHSSSVKAGGGRVETRLHQFRILPKLFLDTRHDQ